MLSLDNIDFVKKSSEKQFVDRWKFKVTLPDYDADKMHKAIADVPCVDQYSIETELTPWNMNISFEVTDYGFSEYMKAFIERNGWHCMVINSPRSYTNENTNNNCGCWRFDVSLPTQDFTELFNRWRRTDVKDEIEILREFSNDDGRSSLTDLSFIVRNCTLYLSLCGEFKQKGYHFNSRHITKDGSTHYKQILSELSGLPTSASDKEHAEAIVKEDTKMSKVKTQAPTYYPSFMKFIKVVRSGPVTVAWIKSNKKVMVRKTKKDKDDLEKAMLMLFAKSQFDSEAAFHRWFRDQMKMFKEAENNAKN